MLLKKIKSEGLAQLSYIIGDRGKAAVIGPRRDCCIYRDIADREGMQITHIFETHRNEDFVIGSCELADLTGAAIYHGAELPFEYGRTAREDDVYEFGNIVLRVVAFLRNFCRWATMSCCTLHTAPGLSAVQGWPQGNSLRSDKSGNSIRLSRLRIAAIFVQIGEPNKAQRSLSGGDYIFSPDFMAAVVNG